MKKMKKAAIVATSVFVASMMSVGSVSAEEAKDPIKLSFAWIVDRVDISQKMQYEVACAYADMLNETRDDIEIELQLFDSLAEVEQEVTNMELAIANNVDGIILSAIDQAACKSYVEQAEAVGIPVLDWRGDIGTLNYVGSNEAVKGDMARDWLEAYLEANPDVMLNACLQLGATSHPQCFARINGEDGKSGVYDVEKNFPDQFKVLNELNSDWSSETSMAMVEDWLQVYPEMNCIVSASEEQMLGCVEALRGAGVLEDFILVTFNGEITGINMMREGELHADIGQKPSTFMTLLLEHAIKMVLEGETGDVDESAEILQIVTPDTVEDYIKHVEYDFMNNTYFESRLLDDYTGYEHFYKDLRS